MYSLWIISLYAPKVVCRHIYIPSTVIVFFHDLQIKVESFTLLITVFTKVFREVSKMTEQKNAT